LRNDRSGHSIAEPGRRQWVRRGRPRGRAFMLSAKPKNGRHHGGTTSPHPRSVAGQLTVRTFERWLVVDTSRQQTKEHLMTATHDTAPAGIEAYDATTDGLRRLLAETYTLYLKTHNYHWNVTGPMFHSLHLMFESQYNELALAVDLIAERIRALGAFAPASYREFAQYSTIGDDDDRPDATEMIRRLLAGQDAVIRAAKAIFPDVSAVHDEPTADMLTQRIQAHEKAAWMLRSLLA
jgi:starvation-inducible DNA-binding protein